VFVDHTIGFVPALGLSVRMGTVLQHMNAFIHGSDAWFHAWVDDGFMCIFMYGFRRDHRLQAPTEKISRCVWRIGLFASVVLICTINLTNF
jgi:hypothetical protein